MPNWIKDAARKMREENERLQKTAEFETARQNALSASGPVALQKLIEAVERDIALFNEEFPHPQKRLNGIERMGDHAFQVVRQYQPEYILQVRLDGERIGFQVLAKGKTEGSYRIGLGPNSEIQLLRQSNAISFEDASKELIAPALLGLEDV